uniref:Uncharacterized protein n=1 Tax=Ixodes ricinus TaxID=34613 RepID=A0A6B0UZ56_IXORI
MRACEVTFWAASICSFLIISSVCWFSRSRHLASSLEASSSGVIRTSLSGAILPLRILRNRPWFRVSLMLKTRLRYLDLYLVPVSLKYLKSSSSMRTAMRFTSSPDNEMSSASLHLLERESRSTFRTLMRTGSISGCGGGCFFTSGVAAATTFSAGAVPTGTAPATDGAAAAATVV